MITIKKAGSTEGRLKDYTKNKHDLNRSAFIGRCGGGPSNSLYLITYNYIVLLENPSKIWGEDDAELVIEKWVDLDIEIKTR